MYKDHHSFWISWFIKGGEVLYKIKDISMISLPICKVLGYLLPQTDAVFHLDLADCLLTTVSNLFIPSSGYFLN